MCDTVTVILGDIVLLAFEKIICFWAQKNCIFTTAQISVNNCTKFFTTAQSVHNCTLKKPWRAPWCSAAINWLSVVTTHAQHKTVKGQGESRLQNFAASVSKHGLDAVTPSAFSIKAYTERWRPLPATDEHNDEHNKVINLKVMNRDEGPLTLS